MTPLYHIHISEDLKFSHRTDLFSVLERLLPVNFFFNEQSGINPSGEIIFKDLVNQNIVVTSKIIPSFSAPLRASISGKYKQSLIEVKFEDDPNVPNPYRGRILTTKVVGIGHFISLRQNERVLASCRYGPLWTMFIEGGMKHYRSCLPFPEISTNENFSDVFNGGRFLEMLPLMQFLREVCEMTLYKSPPLRAAYIIDDPNLHWPKYGYVDYREIALHAQRENYHVSFATIPIDMLFTHLSTAEVFRGNARWLSLVVHGNNHEKEELAGKYSHAERKALLQQAIHRIKRLEQKTNLRVCRVMVPPHGACSNEMLAELPRFGFESACISTGSLRHYNRDKSWVKTLGLYPSEVIEGCPVLPRSGLTGSIENTLLLEAYLGRPMILRGHHRDLKNGVEVLDIYAKFINGFGNVIWSNMTDLSRLNYLWRMEGTRCHIKPLGKKIIFQLPSVATDVVIEGLSTMENGTWQAIFADGFLRRIKPGVQLPLTDAMGREVLLEHTDIEETDPISIRIKPTSSKLIVRRILTIARDRFLLS